LDELEEEPEAFILDAKYEKQTAKEIVDHQKHLSQFERQGLIKVLEKFDTLFDGTMGPYPHKKSSFGTLPGFGSSLCETLLCSSHTGRCLKRKNYSTY
jgi:hypothetical protein